MQMQVSAVTMHLQLRDSSNRHLLGRYSFVVSVGVVEN